MWYQNFIEHHWSNLCCVCTELGISSKCWASPEILKEILSFRRDRNVWWQRYQHVGGPLHLHLLQNRSAAREEWDEERVRTRWWRHQTWCLVSRQWEEKRHWWRCWGSFLGVRATDKMGTENIRGTADMEGFGAKAREARLRWFEQKGSKHEGCWGWSCKVET